MLDIDEQTEEDEPKDEPYVIDPLPYKAPSADETVRRSGLAYSAGIVLFTAIAFMLFLGWIADVLLGSSPWGIVAGIVIGSIIGFIQFFRISSQIFGNSEPPSSPRTLFKDDRDA